ncbi:MAG: EamA family transporter [Flavipsychrobacter sp.]|nr:EamA family transporter [Flavipsychrobacter sp.]
MRPPSDGGMNMTKQTKAYLALLFICIVWGTTYLAIRVGVLHYPPFLFAGVRQVVAGLVLILVGLLRDKNTGLTRQAVVRQMIMGFLMLTIGNGGVTWGEKYIPSGIAALLCSLMPMFAVLFGLLSAGREKLNAGIVGGMVLGFAGVGLIFRQNFAEMSDPRYLGGMAVTLLATASWAFGSTLNKKHGKASNALFNSGMQLMFGGLFMLMVSPVADDFSGFNLWDADGVAALVYLIIFGSVLAYAAYMYVLDVLPVGVATIYAYVNPLIAVLAGSMFLDEQLNIYIVLAFVAIAVSVFLVNRGYKKLREAN